MLRCITVQFAAECSCHAGSTTLATGCCLNLSLGYCLALKCVFTVVFITSGDSSSLDGCFGVVGSHLSRKTVRFYCCLNFGMILCVPGLGQLLEFRLLPGLRTFSLSWEEIYCGLFIVVSFHARPLGLVLQRCSIWRRCCSPVYLRCKVTVLQCYLCDRVLCLG